MIIDLILDRKDGLKYSPSKFYRDICNYGAIGFEISNALDNGTNDDIKKSLCNYIDKNDYNPDIKNYINSQTWLE